MAERHFQSSLIKRLREMFPDCVILKNDAGYLQGVPDLLILFGKKWGALEVKKAINSSRRPNQDHFVEKLNRMSFAAFIHPGNVEEVLRDLQAALRPGRKARVPQPE